MSRKAFSLSSLFNECFILTLFHNCHQDVLVSVLFHHGWCFSVSGSPGRNRSRHIRASFLVASIKSYILLGERIYSCSRGIYFKNLKAQNIFPSVSLNSLFSASKSTEGLLSCKFRVKPEFSCLILDRTENQRITFCIIIIQANKQGNGAVTCVRRRGSK